MSETELANAIGVGGLFLCLGLAATGTSLGMMRAARAAVGVLSEEPRFFSLTLVLTFLPMTQTLVYGLGFLILANNTLLQRGEVTLVQGLGLLALAIFVGLAELVSAYGQGSVCSDVIVMLPKTKGAIFTQGLIMAAYLEFIGLLGLVFGYMLLTYILVG